MYHRLVQKLEALATAPHLTNANVSSKLYKFYFDPPPCFIAKLSPELLSEIFILHCQGNLSNASVIASVCTRWRDVVIAESRLWVSRISVDVDDLGELCAVSYIHSLSMLLSTALRRWETIKLDFCFVTNDVHGKALAMSLFSTLLQHRSRWRSVYLCVSPLSHVIIPWCYKRDFCSLESFTIDIPGCQEPVHYEWMYDLLSKIGHAPSLASLNAPIFPYNLSHRRILPSNAFSQLTHFEAQQCDLSSFVELILSTARTSLVSCSVTSFAFSMPFFQAAFLLPKLEALTLPFPGSNSFYYDRVFSSLLVPELKELTLCGHFCRNGGEMELIRRLIKKSGCQVKKLQLAPMTVTDYHKSATHLVS
ncbi:hypothetical protein E1B28_009477 [Marasmius oreades]|uniref:F-box domain-containing protein n=1 Tax=Marasmius oreades TaxID=181124 RepID=A0A9P7RVB8_9AGAR|nr:uncharacterized protein E1B28_009477 [Marasmius oreades]KAG7090357.1 hypothetical protein E1B28_009477 [Marasmius oreades]